ncbi:hypothetical protein LTR91_011918 [Friedmanniomyces endolithicus]|uniref:Uncharacterized protein n=1 Tax=Friedmanniomyces endolithicus TaxID=329885 RepID=A0AAN6QRE8_9PEZI|nr:hypothetical protein LTR91_011918 [Friedmanniomyces endolithicus]
MSLTILTSSPITYGQTPAPTSLAPEPCKKRPKLTLDTHDSSSLFGKASTSLRLETLSATSPTVRNTFRNGHDAVQQRRTSGGKRPSLAPLATDVPSDTSKKFTPLFTESPSSPEVPDLTDSSAASYSSTPTVDSLSAEVPYRIAFNITSILSNSPIPRTRYARNRFAQSRPLFPAAKKVMFRAPLTEDIMTSRYTMAHSDIEISITSIPVIDTDPVENTEGESHATATTTEINVHPACVAATAPHTGEKRESSDEEDSDTCPATPVAGRRKKSRVWRWTLGPVEASSKQEQPDGVSIGEVVYDGASSDP